MGNDQSKKNTVNESMSEFDQSFIAESESPTIKKVKSTIKPHKLNDLKYKQNIDKYKNSDKEKKSDIKPGDTGKTSKTVGKNGKVYNNMTSLVASEHQTSAKTSSKKFTGSLDINSSEGEAKTLNSGSNQDFNIRKKFSKKKSVFFKKNEVVNHSNRKKRMRDRRRRRDRASNDYTLNHDEFKFLGFSSDDDEDKVSFNEEVISNIEKKGSHNKLSFSSFKDELKEIKKSTTNPLNNAIIFASGNEDESGTKKKVKARFQANTNYNGLKKAGKVGSCQVFPTQNGISHYSNPKLSIQSQRRVRLGFGEHLKKNRPSQIRSILKKTLSISSNINLRSSLRSKNSIKIAPNHDSIKVVPNSNYEKNNRSKTPSKFVHFNRKKYVYTYESHRELRLRAKRHEESHESVGSD